MEWVPRDGSRLQGEGDGEEFAKTLKAGGEQF